MSNEVFVCFRFASCVLNGCIHQNVIKKRKQKTKMEYYREVSNTSCPCWHCCCCCYSKMHVVSLSLYSHKVCSKSRVVSLSLYNHKVCSKARVVSSSLYNHKVCSKARVVSLSLYNHKVCSKSRVVSSSLYNHKVYSKGRWVNAEYLHLLFYWLALIPFSLTCYMKCSITAGNIDSILPCVVIIF